MNLFKVASRFDALLRSQVKRAQDILYFGDKASPEELEAFRDNAFRNLITHSYENVPYYRDLMNDLRINPRDIRGLSDIEIFPILTKEIVRAQADRLRSRQLRPGTYIVRRSGGTTGEPIPSYVNALAAGLETYSYFRGLEWMGWKPSYKRILLSGGSLGLTNTTSLRFKLKALATRIVALKAFDLNKDNLTSYYNRICDSGPCIVTGYASVLRYFTDLCDQNDLRFNNVNQVFSTAELLPDDWRIAIARTFNCPVKCFYGCGEVNSLGYQIEEGGEYIVPSEHVHLESVIDSSIVEKESLLLTSLFNYAQPLIRYANGDMGTLSYKNGRQIITHLDGRTSDMFIRRDGSKLSSSFGPHAVFVGKIAVSKYQYIQVSLNEVVFRYTPIGQDINPEERSLIVNFLKDAMGEISVKFQKTSQFEVGSNGKHRIMICKVGTDLPIV